MDGVGTRVTSSFDSSQAVERGEGDSPSARLRLLLRLLLVAAAGLKRPQRLAAARERQLEGHRACGGHVVRMVSWIGASCGPADGLAFNDSGMCVRKRRRKGGGTESEQREKKLTHRSRGRPRGPAG